MSTLSRNYDAKSGRFDSEDSAQDGLNWYTYCQNNPTGYHDPSGNVAQVIAGGAVIVAVAIVIVGTTVVVQQMTSEGVVANSTYYAIEDIQSAISYAKATAIAIGGVIIYEGVTYVR